MYDHFGETPYTPAVGSLFGILLGAAGLTVHAGGNNEVGIRAVDIRVFVVAGELMCVGIGEEDFKRGIVLRKFANGVSSSLFVTSTSSSPDSPFISSFFPVSAKRSQQTQMEVVGCVEYLHSPQLPLWEYHLLIYAVLLS
jgi:hypothetical protein